MRANRTLALLIVSFKWKLHQSDRIIALQKNILFEIKLYDTSNRMTIWPLDQLSSIWYETELVNSLSTWSQRPKRQWLRLNDVAGDIELPLNSFLTIAIRPISMGHSKPVVAPTNTRKIVTVPSHMATHGIQYYDWRSHTNILLIEICVEDH